MPPMPEPKASQPKLSQFFSKISAPKVEATQPSTQLPSAPSQASASPKQAATAVKPRSAPNDRANASKPALEKANPRVQPAQEGKLKVDDTVEEEHAQSIDCSMPDAASGSKAESSDEECISRRRSVRQKGKKTTLCESSSEGDDDSSDESKNPKRSSHRKKIACEAPKAVEPVDLTKSSSPDPVEVTSAVPHSSTPPSSRGQTIPLSTPATKSKASVKASGKKSLQGLDEDERRHAEFVEKVSLVRHAKDSMESDSPSGAEQGGRLEPCALQVPRGAKLTPFEEQVVAIKRANPQTVLFVECGYKFRFLGRDAEIAAKVLNIFHHMDHNFLSASIPTFRLEVHMRRMVEAGYKVGVVRQMETAALKAVSTNKSKAFERSLCEVFTKATIPVEDVDILGVEKALSPSNAVYLLAVAEQQSSAAGDSIVMGMMAVDTASGDMVYDEWNDDELRTELESRLSQLQPKELLLPTGISSASRLLLTRFATAGSLRLETLDDSLFERKTATNALKSWFRERQATSKSEGSDEPSHSKNWAGIGVAEVGCVGEGRVGTDGVDSLLQLPPTVLGCINALRKYLTQFNLQQVLKLTGNIWRFASGTHMIVEASVLENLEVLATEKGEEGSLYWLLKATSTAFGARLLRHWITHPLLSMERIEARHEAIAELLTDHPAGLHWEEVIKSLPDLERALARVQYQKCGPRELVALLTSLANLCTRARQGKPLAESLKSPLLKSLMNGFPDMSEALQGWLDAINVREANEQNPDKCKLLVGYDDPTQYPAISAIKSEMSEVEEELSDHLDHWRKTLRLPDLEYKTLLTTPYLIEVPVTQTNKVPKDWLKMSGTQKMSRYHTPFIQEKYAQTLRLQEKLDGLCTAAWQEFLSTVAVRYAELRGLVQGIAVMDCLFSLARVAKRGGWCRPEMQKAGQTIDIVAGRHPMVEAMIGDRYVPNDVKLSHDSQRSMVITGPNMGGKSSLIRQTALIVLMSQIGSYVPAQRARVSVVDAIYTRMGARDAISQGRSTFLVEMQEASHILRQATSRSLVIMDELGRGTSTHDGTAIAYATLRELVERVGCLTLFVTHYHLLCNLTAVLPRQVGNYHVGFMAAEGDRVTFLYRLQQGSAHRSFGLNVASMAGLPAAVIDRAREQAAVMERNVKERIGSHIPRLFRVATEAAGGAAGAEELPQLQEEARKALILVGRAAPPAP